MIVFRGKDGSISPEIFTHRSYDKDADMPDVRFLCMVIGMRLNNDPEFIKEQLNWFNDQMNNLRGE